MGSGGNAAGSGATPAGAFALHLRTSVHRGQADRSAGPPAARAPEAARQRCMFSLRESLRRATNRRRGTGSAVSRKAVSVHMESLVCRRGGDMSTPQKCPPTRNYLQTTLDNRRYACLPLSGGDAVAPRRTGRSVHRCISATWLAHFAVCRRVRVGSLTPRPSFGFRAEIVRRLNAGCSASGRGRGCMVRSSLRGLTCPAGVRSWANVLPVCSVLSVRPDGGHQVLSPAAGGGDD
jgi:hypothetical protein